MITSCILLAAALSTCNTEVMNVPERVLELPSGKNNPRNSEGAFLRLRDGRIAFAYSRYSGGSADDHAYAEIACVFSSDEGETFGDERILVRPDPDPAANETNCMSVSLMRMANGDVGLFYLLKRNYSVVQKKRKQK